jgi:hypothetical protein
MATHSDVSMRLLGEFFYYKKRSPCGTLLRVSMRFFFFFFSLKIKLATHSDVSMRLLGEFFCFVLSRHRSKVLGHNAPSTVLYASQGVPDCTIHP